MFNVGDAELEERLLRDSDFALQENKEHLFSEQR